MGGDCVRVTLRDDYPSGDPKLMVAGSRMPRRILHTSDLHLASLGDKASRSLEALVDLAIEARVDLVIIAGDLFDHNRIDDDLVSFAVRQLQRLPVYAVILPGNHDCLAPDSVFNRVHLWQEHDNIRVFRAPCGEMLDLPGLGISLWGKPIDSYDRDVRPLVGIPQPQGNGQWHIVVAHGYYAGTEFDRSRSFLITRDEIIMSGQDYIALGHWPSFSCVCSAPVKAYYCGSPSVSGTVLVVDLVGEAGVQVTRDSL